MSEPLVRLRPYRDYRGKSEEWVSYWEERLEQARVNLEQVRPGASVSSPPSDNRQIPAVRPPVPSDRPSEWLGDLEYPGPGKAK